MWKYSFQFETEEETDSAKTDFERIPPTQKRKRRSEKKLLKEQFEMIRVCMWLPLSSEIITKFCYVSDTEDSLGEAGYAIHKDDGIFRNGD